MSPVSGDFSHSRTLPPASALKWFALTVVLTLLMALFGQAHGQSRNQGPDQGFVPVPELKARVTDQVGMLKPDERARLESALQEREARTGNQLAILLLKSTEPESIEQYAIRVADAWKLGRKGIDDGVILVVARDNPPALRRLRIEAGRGVQGSLTDAQSKRILQDVIAPHFRQQDWYGGLAAGSAAIADVIARENLPSQQQRAAIETDDALGWWPLLFFAFLVLLSLRRGLRGARRFSTDGWGRSAGVVLGSGLGWGTDRDLYHGRGWGGLGGRSGGFGGGGFSGGGGGFDGGGASGNW